MNVLAGVTDESGQLLGGETHIVVHQGEFYIGAAPENYIGTANQPQNINLITVDWDSQPRPGVSLSVRAVERIWQSQQVVDVRGGLTCKYTLKENQVADAWCVQAPMVKPFSTLPLHVAASTRSMPPAATPTKIRSPATFLWVAGPGYIPWRQKIRNQIDLKVDQDNYKVGDTASVLIPSPFEGETTALITVERGHLIKTDVVKLTSNSTVYKLPITPDMVPNAYIYVNSVKGVDAANPVATYRAGLASFKAIRNE